MDEALDTPDWRWKRAVDLVDDNASPSRLDDEITVRAWRFLKRKRAASQSKLATLKADYPDIYAADKIYQDENDFRWLTEAALCTDADIKKIADDFKLSVATIEAYNKLFWDIRGVKLQSLPYVESHILRPALRNRTLDENSPDWWPKVTALTLGYDALLASRKFGDDSPEQQKLEVVAHASKTRQLSLEAAHTTAISRFNGVELVKALIEQEQKRESIGANRDASVEAVREILASVTFKRRALADPVKLDKDGLEPRLLKP